MKMQFRFPLSMLSLLLSLLTSACMDVTEQVSALLSDRDNDGYVDCNDGRRDPKTPCDCDDLDPAFSPTLPDGSKRPDVCDYKDNDCDGQLDEDQPGTLYYPDADGDGYGEKEGAPTASCEPLPRQVSNHLDCDDATPFRSPVEEELCDGMDNDCNGQVDDYAPPVSWYLDQDEDGYGTDEVSIQQCLPPENAQYPYARAGGDCNDGDPLYHPGAVESCDGDAVDYNCDGATGAYDNDGDGHIACEECNDNDETIHPDALETCNDKDDNCDGSVDNVPNGNRYRDGDDDTFAVSTDDARTLEGCVSGWTDREPDPKDASSYDCNDMSKSVYPGAEELCDGQLNNCTGEFPDDEQDHDEDGVAACAQDALPADCDDADPARSPLLLEACDGVDNDCDGEVPFNELDQDADGFRACEECADADALSYPGGYETCDGVDNDCDETIDEDLQLTLYPDKDEDGYGDGTAPTPSCTELSRYSLLPGDCDDEKAHLSPGHAEIPADGLDNNCNGQIDEDQVCVYPDGDGDGYGAIEKFCDMQAASLSLDGKASATGDCDDLNASTFPGASEACDQHDNDCDGSVDEGVELRWYVDEDEDGYGSPNVDTSKLACSRPAGFSAYASDCNDADSAIHPEAVEVCGDDIDDNCDGSTTDGGVLSTWYPDKDLDGYGNGAESQVDCVRPDGFIAQAGDCDDDSASTHPGAEEVCDNADNDCDGPADEHATDATWWYLDQDVDGWGANEAAVETCSSPDAYVAVSGDCDDTDPTIHPEAESVVDNGIDEDCDGQDPTSCGDLDGVDVYVSVSGEAPCEGIVGAKTVGEALSKVPDADLIVVAAGRYSESLELQNKRLTLRSEALQRGWEQDGQADTWLLASKAGALIQVLGGNLTLEGFTLTGGTGTAGQAGACFEGSSSERAGGAICARGTTTAPLRLNLAHVTLIGNTATYGGELYVRDATTTGTLLKLAGGTGMRQGGGIYQSGGTLKLTESSISGFSGVIDGGGMYVAEGSTTLEGLTFASNIVSGNGGGLYYVASSGTFSLTLENSTFKTSSATNGKGGGVFVSSLGEVVLKRIELTDNTSAAGGGGAYLKLESGAALEAQDTTFVGNSSKGFGGGGFIELGVGSVSTFENLEFSQNSTTSSGGGLYLVGASATATFEELNFTRNVSSSDGGGMYANVTGDVQLRGLDFADNTGAKNGGGLYLAGGGVLEDVELFNSRAQNGAAIYLTGSAGISRLLASGNSASLSGGGLYCDSSSRPKLANLQVVGNRATQNGAGVYAAEAANCQLQNATIVRNRADKDGGGLFITSSSSLGLSNSIVAYNVASNDGSNLYHAGNSSAPTFSLLDSLLYNPASDLEALYGVSSDVLQSNHILQRDPGFIRDVRYGALEDVDLHLRSDSPARNQGNSASSANDPDGSRNDLGAFGGPNSAATDEDEDGLPDDWELRYDLEPAQTDAADDDDDDGLSNADEYQAGLNPTEPDSDGDGVDDHQEQLQGTHPLDRFDHVPGNAPHITVSAEVASDLPTVQAALDYAFPGTEVHLEAEAYRENLWAAFKSLSLVGKGIDKTTLRGDGTQSVLRLYGMEPGTTVSGLTLTGGGGSFDLNYSGYGGGMLSQFSDLALTSVRVTHNSVSRKGGGGCLHGGTAQLNQVKFDGNHASDYGGGLYTYYSTVTLEHSVVKGNTADNYGGGLYTYYSTVTLDHSVVEGNTAGYYGGGLYQAASGVQMSNSIVAFNTAKAGSSYNNWSQGCPTVYSSVFYSSPTEAGTTCTVTGNGNLTVDPGFQDRAIGNYHLTKDSPLIDQGSSSEQDPDGTRADIGLYGGPDAAGFDLDGDGSFDYFWPGTWLDAPAGFSSDDYDCDDSDPTVTGRSGCF